MVVSSPSIIVITGPTAAGKSAIALEIAQRIPTSIVCADSRQVFSMMDIGTAKPTTTDMLVCQHRLFSIVHPRDTFNAGQYATAFRSLFEGGEGLVLMVGGTGLYINAALDGLSPTLANTDPSVRELVQLRYNEGGKEELYRWLMELDKKAAEVYSDMNPRRLQRAIEYSLQTGTPFSETWEQSGVPFNANIIRFVIDRDTEELKKRINDRCVKMWELGLLDETERILSDNVPATAQSLHTVGYTQALQVLGYGEPLSKPEAIVEHQTATRRYAKRQRTWFRKDPRFERLDATNASDIILQKMSKLMLVTVAVLLAVQLTFAATVDTLPTKTQRSTVIPSQYDSAQAVRSLANTLNAIFSSRAYRNTKAGCMVWNITRNKVMYDYNSNQRLTPASTTKLFSTAAAFHALGSHGALVTEVRGTGRLLTNGTLEGDLYLVGMGDAMLNVNDLEILADELFAIGIRRIKGKVYGDGTFFDNVSNRAIYSGDGEEVQAMPPVRALSINEGKLAIVVSATRSGRVSAQSIPASDAVVITVGQSSSKKRGRRRSRLSVTSSTLPNGKQHITVSGSPGANRSRTVFVSMADPALVSAGALASRLAAGGIEVEGGIGTARFSAISRVLAKKSRPLTEFCSVVNKRSHNYFAEQIFKVVGGQYGGRTNTADTARKAILATLDSLKVARRGTVLNDGSGLSRRNLTCPATQVDLLRAIYNRSYGEAFMSTLAIAGVDGTIRGRMHDSPAENNVRAKTGTLRNTSALSGYVTTLDGELWCFSILSNGPYTRSYKAAENQAAIALAGFSYTGKTWFPDAGQMKAIPKPPDLDELDTGLAEEDADILDSLLAPKDASKPVREHKSKHKP